MLSYVSSTRKCSPFPFYSSVCILVPDERKLMMKNKTTEERSWDNHIDSCVKMCEGKDETQAVSGFQCCRHCDEFAGALHGQQVCLSRHHITPVPKRRGAALSSQHSCLLQPTQSPGSQRVPHMPARVSVTAI